MNLLTYQLSLENRVSFLNVYSSTLCCHFPKMKEEDENLHILNCINFIHFVKMDALNKKNAKHF